MELWALGQTKEALQLARRTRELDTRSPYLAVLEADYLLRDDQFDAAIALYQYAIKLDPQNANALFGLAEARMRQRRWDEAIEARRRAHEVAGDDRLTPLFATAKGEAGYRQIDEAWVRLQLEELKERERTNTCRRWTSREYLHRLARRSWPSSTSTPPSWTDPLVLCF